MKKRILSMVLSICMLAGLLVALPITASAATSGTCGGNLTWTLDDNGTLTISGTGEMKDYNSWSLYAPWYTERSNITNVVIEKGVTNIGEYAFYYCTKLTSITIPDTVTSIGKSAFSVCESLASITIPKGITSISESAFSYCEDLASITIPDTVTSIEREAFNSCKRLTEITLPEYLESIGGYAFEYSALNKIEIPDSVTDIGIGAFYGCYSLTKVDFGNGLQKIGENVFYNCSALIDLSIPESVVNIGNGAFFGCKAVGNIVVDDENEYYSSEDNVLYNKNKTLLIKYAPTKLDTMFIVPPSVIGIGDGAFYQCNNLSCVVLPDCVTSIGEFAFSSCYNLKNMTIPDGVTYIDRYTFSFSDLTDVVIPDGVTKIDEYAFSYCGELNSITIPNSVKEIGYSAFNECNKLKDVYFLGTEDEWSAIDKHTDKEYLGGNVCLISYAKIHFVEPVPTPTPKPTPIPTTTAEVTKTETDEEYTFEVNAEDKHEGCYVYATTYDENGALLGVNKVELDTENNTMVSIGKNGNAEKAKVFIFSKYFQPIIDAKVFELK